MSRLVVLLGAALLAGVTPAEAEGPPRCRVDVALDPPQAFVGQQVIYELRILRRRDVAEQRWERTLTFPTFRAEWLPGRAADAPVEADGETYLAYHERRALFPAHPGELRIPEASLHCAAADGGEIVRIPEATLVAMPLPAAGAPPGFDGVVGRVRLTASVTPLRTRVGESLRVSVLAQGPADLWRVATLADDLRALPDVEVFERPVETARDAGRRLVVRRYYTLDLVPHREGTLALPPVRLPFFDPATARYEEARAALGTALVLPRAAPPEAPGPEAGPASAPSAASRARRWVLAALAALALAAVVTAWRLSPRGRDRHEGAEDWLRAAEEAGERGALEEAAGAAARSLRAALLPHEPAARSLAAEELRARRLPDAAAREAVTWLERLERARFASDRDALAELLRDPGWRTAVRAVDASAGTRLAPWRRLLESGR